MFVRSARRWLASLAAVLLTAGAVAVTASPAQAAGPVTVGNTAVVEQATATSTVSLPKPSGVVTGDALVATFTVDFTPSVTPPAGWTAIAAPLSISTGARLFSYLHVVTNAGSEPASYSFGLSAAQKWGGTLTAFHNVDPVNPLDSAVTTKVDGTYTASTLSVPSVTTQTAGAVVISGVGADRRDAAFTVPSGGTLAGQAREGQGTALGYGAAVGTPGATGSATWSMTAGTAAAGWMTALRPAAGPPPAPATVAVTGTTPGNGQVVVNFSVDPGTQNVTGIRACRNGTDTTGAGPWCGDLPPTQRSITFTKLFNGTAYAFTVQLQVDGALYGTAASTTATPSTGTPPPPVPTAAALTLTPGNGTVAAAWSLTVGTDGANGAILSRDGVDTNGTGAWSSAVQSGTSGTLTFDKLVNGSSYNITVQPTANGTPVGTPVIKAATPTTGTPPPPAKQCADGIDNDGDTKVDYPADPGCSSATDDDETDPVTPPPPAQCADGLDNDSDGKVDLADPGCTASTDDDETDPVAPPAPVAAFSSSTTSGPAPLTVTFSDTSTGNPTAWAWDFGDGGTSAAQNPVHTYAAAGTYTVTLVATNAGGNSSPVTTTVTVATTPPPSTPALPGSGPVPAKVETQPFSSGSGDIADDPAIWVNPTDPSASVVIGSKKDPSSGGLAVYDLAGTQLQFLAAGELNNVDVRSGVLGNRVLVMATDRTTNALRYFTLNPATRQLSAAGSTAVGWEPYGGCLYVSPVNGDVYAFVNQRVDSGAAEWDQYRLTGTGTVTGTKVRDMSVSSLAEGCVADDAGQGVFLSQEDVGLYRYGAEPGAGSTRTTVDTVGSRLVADIEGVTIARDRGTGPDYLVVSSQGNSTYQVYDLAAPHTHRKSFTVTANSAGTVDGASGSDGIDITRADLGSAFPQGLLVVHDEANTGGSVSNFKLVDAGLVLGAYGSTTPPPPPPGTAPNGPAGTWVQTFGDEFTGTSLDSSKWARNWYGEGATMNGVGTYGRNVSVHDGAVYLQLESTSAGALIHTDISGGYRLPVGSYTEARIYFPGPSSTSLSNWAAWWASAAVVDGWPSSGEHDIAEVLSGSLTVNYHSPSGAHNQGAVSGFTPGNSWHTYGLHRKAGSADVYWDGVKVKTYATDDSGKPEILILNVGNGSNDALGQSGAMRVDYVRAWAPA